MAGRECHGSPPYIFYAPLLPKSAKNRALKIPDSLALTWFAAWSAVAFLTFGYLE
jgi:hypothetical protein